jgi:PAS domain S-box-containing protein
VSTSWRQPDNGVGGEGTPSLHWVPPEHAENPSPKIAADGSVRDLLQALDAAIYTTDAHGRITSYNEAAALLWGHRPTIGTDQFCGSWKLYWPDGRPLPHDECPMALSLSERRPIRGMEAVAERPDGSRVAFMPYPTPLFDAAGALTGAVNMLVDISEHKHIERALARHRDELFAMYRFTDRLFRAATLEEIYRAALDAISAALGCERASILILDDAKVMKFVAWSGLSEGYRRAVEGHSPWKLDDTEPELICVPDVASADLASDLRTVVKAEGIRALSFIPLVVRGRLIGKFMTYHDVPRKFSDHDRGLAITIARQLGFGIDRMRADEARRRAEHARSLLASIIENSSDAIISKDLNGVVTSWNRGAEHTYGYAVGEMIGKSLAVLVPPDQKRQEDEVMQRIRAGEAPESYETVRRCKDGTNIDVSVTISPIRDEAGHVVGASKIARNISERKHAQERQELLTREIQHRTKNLFAVVRSVVSRSFAEKESVEDAKKAVLSRLHTLAQTHTMLLDTDWRGAELGEVIRSEMSPYNQHVNIDGPHVLLNPKAAQNFALALHELATNAAKYGALSSLYGRIDIEWSLDAPATHLTFRWQERDGPTVKSPSRKGFGSVVLEHVMAEYFCDVPRIVFDPLGIVYEVRCAMSAISPEDRGNGTTP